MGKDVGMPPQEWGPVWALAWLMRHGGQVRYLSQVTGDQAADGQASPPPPAQANGAAGQAAPAKPSEPPQAAAAPCGELTPDDLVPPEALDEARAYEAMGDRKEYSRRMERLFVAGLKRLIECQGPQAVGSVLADFAYILDLSLETTKRYLRKNSSRWGPFEILGDMVRLRR
ncbi:MAG: hypothetical protein Q9O62_13425 [Ardenticatenia bacterium]|nr:hypothetical protein [Ardenticatenia bacterium]